MAVTESKGDGYSLFNGVKLPSLPEWDKVTYPYAVIDYSEKNGYRFYCSGKTFKYDSDVNFITVSENTTVMYCVLTDGAWGGFSEPSDYESFLNYISLPIWTNADVMDGSTVYLAASDPISLDGMNVIELDDDTTGLETVVVSDWTYYKVAEFIDKPLSAVVTVIRTDGTYNVFTEIVDTADGSGWGLGYVDFSSVGLSDGYHVLVQEGEGVLFMRVNSTTHPNLFAYYPTEEEPESTAKAFLLHRMFSKPIAHALTGKWFWWA